MVSSFSYGLKFQWSNWINTTQVNINKIIADDSCKQILNSLHASEVNLYSTTP